MFRYYDCLPVDEVEHEVSLGSVGVILEEEEEEDEEEDDDTDSYRDEGEYCCALHW